MQGNLGWTASWAGNATGAIGILAIFAAPIAAQLAARYDPRKIIFFGVMWLALITFMRGQATTDMNFMSITVWIFLAGAGMPFFFMPLIQVSMGSVLPSEVASAAGLQNFIRTMAGAVATSFVTTAWENSANANHAQMVNNLPNAEAAVQTMTQQGLPHEVALESFNRMVESQALMIATNEIFMGAAVVFALCATLAWTLPRPKGPVDMSSAH